MDPGFLKLLDDDEDDNAAPAADVDAFAAVLKGDLGGAAQAAAAAAAAHGATRTGNGTVQPVPQQQPAAPVTTGNSAIKPVPPATAATPSSQPQLQWSQLTPEQQQAYIQRLTPEAQQHLFRQRTIQQQRLQQQQLLQQPHQQGQQPQRAEPGSGAPGPRRGQIREGISFTALMPLLQPHLPPEQGQQLSVLYQRFKRNEISREDFIRGARVIAGDHVLVQTIREMHGKQQAQQLELQQRELQQQKLREQQQQPHQQQQQSQPQSSESQSAKPQQSLLQNVSASGASQQQQSKELANPPQQTLQPNMTQPTSQTQEPTVGNAAQPKLPLGQPQVHPFLQTQVPSNADPKAVPGSQPLSNLSSSIPQPQPKSSSVKDQVPAQPSNNKAAVPMVLQQVKHEVDQSLAKQQSPSPMMPSIQPRPSPGLQTAVGTGAGQPPQPYSQMGLPPQPHANQTPAHVQLHQSQPPPLAPSPVIPQPQPAPAPSPSPAAAPSPAPAPATTPQAAQPPPEKPLTKYAKQKLRREQKKREEEEKARKLAEEERLKKVEEENLKKLHSTPSGTVMAAHQGLHPQLSTPPVDLNKQAYNHHPGSLSHQAQMQAPVSQLDKQQVAPIAPSGLAATGQGLPLIPVKQEPSDSLSEQKRKSFQVPKTLDLLPGQAGQKPAGQAQLSEASVLPTSQLQGANAEQVPGSMLLPPPSTATSLAQQADLATSLVPIPPIAGASGLQSAVPVRQVAGQQRLGSAPPPGSAASGSFSNVVLALPGQTSQAAATASATPAVKTPSKKPSVGQKKAAESSPAQQPAGKKQKVSAGEPDQSIDQLQDVTAVSGVNLKEEEEQLLIGPKEESRTTEAMRKIVQDEEERLFLQRAPLRAKVAAIATRCGVKNVSEDVGRCLSMSVEERLRSMLYRLIKLSKQRCDVEKERHKIVVSSDVRRKILMMRKKAKEAQDKKSAEESERLRKMNEKKDKGSLPDVEREELKAKAQKAQQEEEDRLKANAANVAARAAVGADDMLSKWVAMAAQGLKKRQGGDAATGEDGAANRGGTSAGASAGHSDKKLENGDSATGGLGKTDNDSQATPTASATGRPPGPGPGGPPPRMLSGRRTFLSKSGRGERTITLKDVVAFLETEPQTSKSTLLYRLYERERKGADGR